ncbi:MAG: hypothetical protein H6818_05140 [Phycisphaerales bacterium]|nr:hypothetical protein [Phycisphaerales bacterium]MCB9863430.1 hypothetical protein [Phycisphaerales bacterium]
MLGAERPIAVCSHLKPDDIYHIWFTGRGRDRYWVCEDCAPQYPTLTESLKEVPDAFLEEFGSEEGICGRPEIRKRPTNLKFTHDRIELPVSGTERRVDFVPNMNTDGDWIALNTSGSIENVDARNGEVRVVGYASPPFWIDENISLCVSPDLEYGAVYQTFGERAHVFHMHKYDSMDLTRGTYCTKHSHFSIAFFRENGRPLLVAATDWNRLEVFDPASGDILTKRGPNMTLKNGKEPKHFFGQFRGQLTVSPDECRIVDNGWVWTPFGSAKVWNLRDWIHRNKWESDDGLSLKYLAWRRYHWNTPACWVGNERIAFWGWGADDDFLIPAILVFDASTGEQTHWFPGPEVRREDPPSKAGHSMFFDKYLFCVHDDHGTGVWDIETGEHLHQEPSLKPIHYHPISKQFLSRTPDGIQLSRLVQ